MELVDTHSHLDVPEFDADRGAVLERARAAGVTRQVVPAIEASTWDALAALCAREPGLHAAYGLHPLLLANHRDADLDALPARLDASPCVAVGEIGLDFFVEGLDAERQREVFRRQLDVARERELPVVVHARRAVDDVTATLRRVGGLTGVVHSFAGSEEQAKQLFKLGFCLGFGGPVTYERAKRLRRIVATMPIEFLMLETDSPDQPLHGHRGARNEPAFLVEVLECVAALRNETPESVAAATTANALRVFRMGT